VKKIFVEAPALPTSTIVAEMLTKIILPDWMYWPEADAEVNAPTAGRIITV